MNIQQVNQFISQQINQYLAEEPISIIQQFQNKLKNTKQNQQKEKLSITNQDAQFIEVPKSCSELQDEAIKSGKALFHQIYGYCLILQTFEEATERFEILRKQLCRKAYQNTERMEQFMPSAVIRQLAKFLPEDLIQVEECIQGGDIKLNDFLELISKEIKYFLRIKQIKKSEIFYHPDMFIQDFTIDDLIYEIGMRQLQIDDSKIEKSL
ncbi:hypothetical protein pb186bvf_019368 [Paramecium bursaria]